MAADHRASVIGASGYTGGELIRLILGHPRLELAGLYAKRAAGSAIGDVFPHLRGVVTADVAELDPDRVAAESQVAFCALPHGASARVVAQLRERDVTVVDLSADFRLRDPVLWADWYGSEDEPAHPAPGLLDGAVYGLPERHREALRGAGLIASPGCYPTGAILAVAPLLERGLIETDGLVIDAKTGASGAGRSPKLLTHLPESGEGVRAYKIAGSHRHTPEMEQELALITGGQVRLIFTPHLVPITRGIFTCVYAAPADAARAATDYQEALESAYADEPFVTVLPPGHIPDTSHVRGSNFAHVAVAYDPRSRRVLVMSAIDNLVKGASGQAVQALNIALGWSETDGLEAAPMFP